MSARRRTAGSAGDRGRRSLQDRQNAVLEVLQGKAAIDQIARRLGVRADPVKAAALREGAEAMLKQVFAVGEERWSWVRHVARVRDTPISVPTSANTVHPSMPPSVYPLWITRSRIALADELKTNGQGRIVGVTTFPSATHLVGLPDPDAAGETRLLPLVRTLVWGSTASLKSVKAALPAEAVMPACPDAQEVDEWVLRGLAQAVQAGWGGAHWHLAPAVRRETNWPRAASTVAKALGGYGNRGADLPVRAGASELRVLPGYEINSKIPGVALSGRSRAQDVNNQGSRRGRLHP
jgi:hypothetical protein